jgi:hypothetical protein
MKHTPKQYQNTYDNRVAQFNKEQKPLNTGTPNKKTLAKTAAASSNNPYVRARIEVLTTYSSWKKKQIEIMERTNDLDNHIYNDFIHDVAVLGDKYSLDNS